MFDYNYNFILTKPTKEEQLKAKIDTSDYQISGLNIQSSILHSFGFCSKIYRSKTATIQRSTKRQTSRYKNVVEKLFAFYRDDEKSEVFFKDMEESDSKLEDRFRIDFHNLFFDIANWKDASRMDVLLPRVAVEIKSKYVPLPKIRFNFAKDSVEEEPLPPYEPSKREIEECKRLYLDLQDFIAQKMDSGISLKKYLKKATLMETFQRICEDELFSSIREDIYEWRSSVGLLRDFILKFLNEKTKETVRMHARTVMEDECLAKQKEVAEYLQGIGMDFDFEGFRYYLQNVTPEILRVVEDRYGFELDDFESFEDFRNFFYSPEKMHEIRESLAVKIRARSKGAERQGAKWAVKSFNLENKIKTLTDSLESFDQTAFNQRLKDLEEKVKRRAEENAEAKNTRRIAKQRYHFAIRKRLGEREVNKRREEYEEIVEAANNTSKLLSAAKAAFRRAMEENKKRMGAMEKVKNYREKYNLILSEAREAVSKEDGIILDRMENIFNIKAVEEETIPYRTWAFKAYGINEDVIRIITGELERAFCDIKGKEGESTYTNVTSYAYLDKHKNAITEFYVDYPKSGKIYKAFERNKNLSSTLINALSDLLEEKLGYTVDFDIKEVVCNEVMEKTLEKGDAPADSWEFPDERELDY